MLLYFNARACAFIWMKLIWFVHALGHYVMITIRDSVRICRIRAFLDRYLSRIYRYFSINYYSYKTREVNIGAYAVKVDFLIGTLRVRSRLAQICARTQQEESCALRQCPTSPARKTPRSYQVRDLYIYFNLSSWYYHCKGYYHLWVTMTFSSDDVNYIIYRYLHESGWYFIYFTKIFVSKHLSHITTESFTLSWVPVICGEAS